MSYSHSRGVLKPRPRRGVAAAGRFGSTTLIDGGGVCFFGSNAGCGGPSTKGTRGQNVSSAHGRVQKVQATVLQRRRVQPYDVPVWAALLLPVRRDIGPEATIRTLW